MAPIVDVHTHIYPPSYISMLEARTALPHVRTFPENPSVPRLVILPDEQESADNSASKGRPLNPGFYDIAEKLKFMRDHNIDISVISLANPWLDFLDSSEAADAAYTINTEIDNICNQYPNQLFAFAVLPLSASATAVVKEINHIASLPWARGIIIGTNGLGKGLDDPALDLVYEAIEKTGLVAFIHPHYGLPKAVYGPQAGDYGHVLPLALGFPLETTVAVTRMLLSGVWERFPILKVLLAHSGGTLPFLAGRIESCIQHDEHLMHKWRNEERRSIWDVLKTNIYLDAVVYSEIGLTAASMASGSDRVLFGTDHPFFPPLGDSKGPWLSVTTNLNAIRNTYGQDTISAAGVLGMNAARLLKLPIPGAAPQ